jgi:hypothetical protein
VIKHRPPRPIRFYYYLWDTRVPPSWLPWVEDEIHSATWLVREVARFLLTFVVVTAIFGRWRFGPLTLIALVIGVGAIVAMRTALRRVAVAYQRYGWEWDEYQKLGVAPYIRIALSAVFAVVFVLLTQ